MADNAAMLLIKAGKKAGNVLKDNQRNVETVAEADKTAGLLARVYIKYAGEHHWLVGHDPDRITAETGETNDNVLGIVLLYLIEIPIVKDQGFSGTIEFSSASVRNASSPPGLNGESSMLLEGKKLSISRIK